MSLWTPGGEHPIERDAASPAAPAPGPDPGPSYDDLTPEEQAQVKAMAEEMEAVRGQLASVPASTVIANHAMGLYELAAIHLTREPPDFAQASLAIDALGAIVDGLAGRLEEPEATLREALGQIRQAFVGLRDEQR
jgi:uncharacterized protein with GYD domain